VKTFFLPFLFSSFKTSKPLRVIFPEKFKVLVLIFFDKKFKRVVFPAPLPPMIAKASPVFTDPDKSERMFLLGVFLGVMVIFSHFNL